MSKVYEKLEGFYVKKTGQYREYMDEREQRIL